MLDLRTLVPWAGGRHVSSPATRDTDPFTAFRREMDRLFDDAFSGRWAAPTLTAAGTMVPRMDVEETETDIIVSMELPGVDEKDLAIDLTGDMLTVKGEKKEEKESKEEGRHVVERTYGSFARSIRLPYNVDAEAVDATVDKGVLTLKVRKPAEARSEPKRIAIKGGSGAKTVEAGTTTAPEGEKTETTAA
ncbi:putative molecular chaperone small heat shock protein, hsp20 family [Caenispirillum salinarum AK4]|uniref:Putative molecular chaperone small heat shock protein, hsp20 family n=1 Tax=Caenispirillum salinarum AK4 TaxID=1238182 RepID=K9H018_9PROT|nr:Hsp20/alpha crystallin family protein [Caenispirillum salinarum]EKV31555.1 putative molecular chaperone small heat shock protein, hsp20 family [Caenispirillum salinarum AK4]